jgi:hypothetical protein
MPLSLVCAMFGRHQQLYDFPELNLFLGDMLGDLIDGPSFLMVTMMELGKRLRYG